MSVDRLFEMRYPDDDFSDEAHDQMWDKMQATIKIYERAFEQMKIDNCRRKYFNEMATMQQIEIAEAKINEQS